MINRTRCLFYEVGGVYYKDLIEAQKAELIKLIPAQYQDGVSLGDTARFADWLLANAEAVATILTTTPKSRIRKPRSDKGKKRTAKGVATAP